MAFDFVSYIGQQVEQAYPNVFVEETKPQRSFFLIHLVSIQLLQLIREKNNNLQFIYQMILDNQSDWLSQISQQTIEDHSVIHSNFEPVIARLQTANQNIASIIIDELHQLNVNANLGESGIDELLSGQISWIHQHCETWILTDNDQHPPKVEEIPNSDAPNFKEIMNDFNHSLLKQTQDKNKFEDTHEQIKLDESSFMTIKKAYYILNPIIALLIIFMLFIILHNL